METDLSSGSPTSQQMESDISKLLLEIDNLNVILECANFKSEDERKTEIMELMHRYNYIKDATQVLVGQLANILGVTCKSMHLKLGLPLDD